MKLLVRSRPFLVLAAITVATFVAALFMEHGISYDDGGVGSVVFLFWLVFLWPAQFVHVKLFVFGSTLSIVAYWITLLAMVVGYLWLDRLVTHWARRRLTSA
jgi:hypothetical protein